MAIEPALVRNLPLFQRLTEAELARLMVRATSRRVAQGETVFEQGAVASTFYLLLHGRLKVSQVTPDGQQVMVRVVHPGDLFGFARAEPRRLSRYGPRGGGLRGRRLADVGLGRRGGNQSAAGDQCHADHRSAAG